jgi:Secretion system C-terminal sorting domain
MNNNVLLISFLSLFVSAQLSAQCAISGSNISDAAVESCLINCGCSTVNITGNTSMQGDWAFTKTGLIINIAAGAALDFKSNTLTLPADAKLVIQPTGSITSSGNQSVIKITIGAKSYVGSDFAAIITGGGVSQLGVLPLELIEFKTGTTTTGILLAWETASETGVSHFEVERSLDAKTFERIGKLPANNKSGIWQYQFEDNAPIATTILYYRLKIKDLDGTYAYSKVVAQAYKPKNTVLLYPTTTEDAVQIQAASEIESVQVLDNLGRFMMQVDGKNESLTTIHLNDLQSGLYFVRIQTAAQTASTLKVWKR